MAGHLKCTVAELKMRMGSDEFIKWLAFSRLRPIGDELQCVLAALTNIVTAGAFGGKLEWKSAYLSQIPDDPTKPQSPEQMQAILAGIAR